MRALIQRVSHAAVQVEGAVVGAIGPGLLVLLGIGSADEPETADWLAEKIATLRIFADEAGRFNHDLAAVGGAVLVVSQFTLYADTRKGRRPNFGQAAAPALAQTLVAQVCTRLRERGLVVAEGQFGAMMQVQLINDGPVTIWLDSAERERPRRA